MNSPHIPLLISKILLPGWRAAWISRPSLLSRLPDRAEQQVVLVSAPAGYGKTTLLAEWCQKLAEQDTAQVVWYSLDEQDNDPSRFFLYLVNALSPELGQRLLPLIQSVSPQNMEQILTELLSHVSIRPKPVLFVLDDYHLIASPAIHSAVSFIVEYLPPRTCLAIGTRADPPLPLSRLRARGRLVEIRAGSMRFSANELNDFFCNAAALDLSAQEIQALEGYTEGWAAGAQLVLLAVSQRSQRPVSGDLMDLLSRFSGGQGVGLKQFTFEYLADEVFARQTEMVQEFLLKTSVLDQLNGPLCAEVTGIPDAEAVLSWLDRANLFTCALDEPARWYRYHHLFRDFLRERLAKQGEAAVSALHRRASDWFERNQMTNEAIQHALWAKDAGWAADILDHASMGMLRDGQVAVLQGWLVKIPDPEIRARPNLGGGQCWALMLAGQADAAEAAAGLVDADLYRWNPPDEAGRQFKRYLEGSIATVRAFVTRQRGDLRTSMDWSEKALSLLSRENALSHNTRFLRSTVLMNLGICHHYQLDFAKAETTYDQAIQDGQLGGNFHAVLQTMALKANIQVSLGRLEESQQIYQRGLDGLAKYMADIELPAMGHLYAGLAKIHYERGDLVAAEWQAGKSVELGALSGVPQITMGGWYVQAAIRCARGDGEGARKLLYKLVDLGEAASQVQNIDYIKAGILFQRLGDATRAKHILQRVETSPGIEQALLWQASIQLNRARLLGAEKALAADAACHLLADSYSLAQGARYHPMQIERLVLSSLLLQSSGQRDQALGCLRQAVEIGMAEGFCRTFVDESEPMRALLLALRERVDRRKEMILLEGVERMILAFGSAQQMGAAAVLTDPSRLPDAQYPPEQRAGKR